MNDRDTQTRLHRVLAAAGMSDERSPAIRLDSDSGEVWRIGDLVVRIGRRGDLTRYTREATLVQSLPSEVKHPAVVDAGRDHDLAWTVTRHVRGERLDRLWGTLTAPERRRAVMQIGAILFALHSWTPPTRVAASLHDHSADAPVDPPALVGVDICPLPVGRAIRLTEHARALPYVSTDLIDMTVDRLEQLAPHDPYRCQRPITVTHGDLHLANLLWSEGDVVAALDFEWARFGPLDQDLEPFLRSVDWAGTGDADRVAPADMTEMLGWLAADHPGLFTADDLVERLWLYQVAYAVRELYTRSASSPPDQLAPHHPLNQLPRFVADDDHIERLLAAVAQARTSG